MKKKWRFIPTISLLIILITGNLAHAAEGFFWSNIAPMLTCTENRDGTPGEMWIKDEDGKTTQIDLPTCEDARKSRVLVLLNGLYLNPVSGSGTDPFIENGRTMIPLRALADGFGFEVEWDQKDKKITLSKVGKTVIMHVGKSEMLVDGKKVKLEDAVPMVKNGVTFLPVRQLAEILGVKVDWNNTTRTATFTESTKK